MPYIPGTVPRDHSSQFLDFELRRIANAFNNQEAIGGLGLNSDNTPGGVVQVINGAPPQLVNAWDLVAPSTAVGDGPVMTVPDTIAKNITARIDGIYLINFYMAFDHELGAEILFEIFHNDTGIGLGTVLDASQQTSASSVSGTGIFSLAEGSVIDLRVFAPTPTETVTWLNGALFIYKLRDLRTRFS